MLSKPFAGWTRLKLDDFSASASYLTDVPVDCLNAFIYALKENAPATVFFDAEGWDYYLVSYTYQTYIIINKDKTTVKVINKCIKELAQELVKDIKLYLDGWANWTMDEEDEVIKYKELLKSKVNELEELIKIQV